MHDVINADCREALKTFARQSVHMVFTDPPYGISNTKNAGDSSLEFSGYSSNKGLWDVEVPAAEWVPLACATLVPGGMFCCFGTFGSLVSIFNELNASGMRFQSHITWHKTNPAPSIHRRMLTHSNELILVFSKGAGWTFDYDYSKSLTGKQHHNHIEMADEPHHNHFDVAAVRKVLGVTRKPIALCEHIIRFFTKPGDVVLDPFAGSGGITLGAKQAQRSSISIEINPELSAYLKRELAE